MELGILIFAIIAHIGIGVFTYLNNPKSATHRFFLLFTVVASFWAVAQYLSLHQVTSEETLSVIRWSMSAAALYSFSLYLTIHTFPSSKIQISKPWIIGYCVLTAIVFIASQTPLIFADIKGAGSSAEPIPGPGIPLFGITAGYFIIGSIFLLIKRYRKAHGLLKAQLQYMLIGVIGSAFLMFFTNFVLVVFFKITSLIIFGPTYTLIFIGTTAYSIIAHQLFDIRIIVRRTLVYSGLLFFAVVAYGMIVLLFSTLFGRGIEATFQWNVFLQDLVAIMVIAAGFEPLRNWLVRLTDKYLFVGTYDSQVVLAELANTLTNVLGINDAVQAVMKLLTDALRVKTAATIILVRDKDGITVKNLESLGYDSVGQIKQLGTPAGMIKYFDSSKEQVLVLEEVRLLCERAANNSECTGLVKEIESFGADVAVPIRVREKLIGILMLGPKLSGDIFSRDDLQFLDIAAKQTASAIEKSRFYEDDQLKSEFVSIASHELLTPTAAIEGYLSMILDEKMATVDPKAEEYLRKVQSSAHRLGELVKDLLSVSRIESGRIVINKQPVEVSPLINQVIGEIKVKADQAEIGLKYLEPTKPLPKALADPERILQIVTNLVSNAIKYNKAGGKIDITAESDGKFVTVHVTDNGIGISEEHQKHLFEKFYRVHDDSAASEKVGTGLGLYITKSIIEIQGGKIWLESEAGKGSTFSFSLPVA